MYVEARLGDLLVQRLSPVSVDPVTGDFSYEGATEDLAVFDVSPWIIRVLSTRWAANDVLLPRVRNLTIYLNSGCVFLFSFFLTLASTIEVAIPQI